MFALVAGSSAFKIAWRVVQLDLISAVMLPTPRSVAICLICFASVALADDFRTIYGKEYKNAKVSRVEPDGIVLSTNSGISKVYFVELSKEVQERFHYDASKAAQFTAATQAAVSENNEAVAKEQASLEQRRKAEIQQQQQANKQQRQVLERQQQIAAQQEQRQLEAQQKQAAKIAAQKKAREQQQRRRRTAGGLGDHWESWKHTTPGGYEEFSGNARMGHYHSESNGPYGGDVHDSLWGPTR